MKFAHIVAASENHVIGKQGKMPWHLSQDLKHFKSITMGHPMVMGRKTFDSLGRLLPGRPHVIVSRRDMTIEGAHVVHSVEAAMDLCRARREEWGEKVFVIGGGEIYRQTFPWVTEIYLTRIHVKCEGDTFYPTLDSSQWVEVEQMRHLDHEPPFSFVHYVHRK